MSYIGQYIKGLLFPIPGTDTPSTAANKIVLSLQATDTHDHTTDNGRLITPAALNINANLPVNGNSLTQLKDAQLVNNVATPTSSYTISVVGGELYYRNASTNLRLTLNGAIDVGTVQGLTGPVGSAGVSYAAFTWTMVDESGGYAHQRIQDLIQVAPGGNTIRQIVGTPTTGYEVIWPSTDPAIDQVRMISNAATGQMTWTNVPKLAGTITSDRFPVFTASNTLSASSAVTNGQLFIGSVGAPPVVATLTGTTNQLTVTNGPGSITLNTPQDIHSAATPTFASITTSTGSNTFTGGFLSSAASTINGVFTVNGVIKFLAQASTGIRVATIANDGTLSVDVPVAESATVSTIVRRTSDGTVNAVKGVFTGTVLTVNGQDVKAHMDATTSVHGATTTATANSLAQRDSSGGLSCVALNATGNAAVGSLSTSGAARVDAGLSTDGGSNYIKTKIVSGSVNANAGQTSTLAHGISSGASRILHAEGYWITGGINIPICWNSADGNTLGGMRINQVDNTNLSLVNGSAFSSGAVTATIIITYI